MVTEDRSIKAQNDKDWHSMAPVEGLKLTPRQEKVLALLISQPNIPTVAKIAGIGERSIYRWMKQEDFATAYRDTRTETVRQALGQIQAAMGAAVGTLLEIMTDPGASAPSRVASARTLIENAIRAVELEEIERRLSIIEKAVYKGRYK